ncbi:MAG TPA: hypothetical protein VKX28_27025 [Xanthobacteraceae bacterium]|nr:hypothetical protein [Xanthobacteraceae bacterium]
MSRATIRTSFVRPPIPQRSFDWIAVYDDYDGAPDSHCPIGFGATKEAAIEDLLCIDPDDAVTRVSDALALGHMAPEEADQQLRRAGVDPSEIDDLIVTALNPSGRPIQPAS